jgi:hypothetical protein
MLRARVAVGGHGDADEMSRVYMCMHVQILHDDAV